MKKIGMVMMVMFVAVALSGCGNTFSGAGKDIERAGQKIQTL